MNNDIKEMIRAAGLYQYQVAYLCGIGETTLVRWLRRELTPEMRLRILTAIEKGGKKNDKQNDNT